jgi:hypothetical protein
MMSQIQTRPPPAAGPATRMADPDSGPSFNRDGHWHFYITLLLPVPRRPATGHLRVYARSPSPGDTRAPGPLALAPSRH